MNILTGIIIGVFIVAVVVVVALLEANDSVWTTWEAGDE